MSLSPEVKELAVQLQALMLFKRAFEFDTEQMSAFMAIADDLVTVVNAENAISDEVSDLMTEGLQILHRRMHDLVHSHQGESE